jgi:hypothetical protein
MGVGAWVRPLALASALFGALSPGPLVHMAQSRDEGRGIFLQHPDWLLPAWTHDGPAAWTMVGAPYGGAVTLIGADGSFAPRNHGPSVSTWVYDLDAGHLIEASAPPRYQFDDDGVPIVSGVSELDGMQLETMFFASSPGQDLTSWFGSGSVVEQAVTFIRIQVRPAAATPRHLAIYIALRPFGVEPDMHPIGSAGCDPATSILFADGAIVLAGLQAADGCGASSLAQLDVASFAQHNLLPESTNAVDADLRAESVLRFNVTAASASPARLEFRVPLSAQAAARPEQLAALTRGSFDVERVKVADAWRQALNRVTLEAPDPRVKASFRASQMYLLLNRTGSFPRSGPLAHDALWVRDAVYIGQALERSGAGLDNQATLEELLKSQRDDGSFPAIVDATGPRAVDELDAPGEVIVGLVSHYRFAHDATWLARVYPSLWRAASFIDTLRGRTLKDGPETSGLLPANMSAEDLGSASWHHYWDDFWAMAGYREAGFAASELGKDDDAVQLTNRADELQAALLRSIDLVRSRTGKDFIPNGPEDVLSSAMARGTTPALWPVRSALGPDLAYLLMRSFHGYDQAWLAPQGGGYLHYEGTLWPYGGLGVAHAMMRLGMLGETRQVLAWTLDHQTLPGTYAWGEAINSRNGGIELGDMPHSWAAAEMISLLRDMLLSEEDGWLAINTAAPDSWFEPGTSVAMRNAPTQYGTASVVMSRPYYDGSTAPALRVELQGDPPVGWRIRLPGHPTALQLDGAAEQVFQATEVHLKPGPHTLVVSFADQAGAAD